MLILQILSTLFGYSLAVFGAGILALKLLAGRIELMTLNSAGTMLATSFILGQGILASLWLLLALAGWLSPLIIGGILFICVLGALFQGRILLGPFGRQMRSAWRELNSDSWGWQGIAVLTLLFCFAWITSIGRPLAGDATAFYLALPKVIAASHRLVPLPGYEDYTNIGLQGELHYSIFMMFNSPESARLFGWPTFLAGAVILLAIGRRIGLGRRGQWILLALLVSSTAILFLSGDGKVDLFAVPFGLSAYYWILQFQGDDQRLDLWLTGLFSGFAIAAKFSYIPVMAPGILLLLFWAYRPILSGIRMGRQTYLRVLSAGLHIGVALLLAMAPQLIKNLLLYQNPIAPFGSEGMGWAKQLWFSTETTRRIALTYPFALTFGSYWGQYGNISPLVLAFLPLTMLLPRPRQMLRSPLVAVTIAASLGLLVWIITQPSVLAPRYVLAPLLLLFLLPARAAEYVSKNDTPPRWLTIGIMISLTATLLGVGLYSLNLIFFPKNTFQYLVGTMNECDRDGEYCRAMTVVNQDANPGDRVYLAAYYRYWLRPDLLQCVNGKSDYAKAVGTSQEKRWLSLYQQGFRYLVADRSTFGGLLDDLTLENPPVWLKLDVLYKEWPLTVYRLAFHNPPVSQITACRQVDPPAWDVFYR